MSRHHRKRLGSGSRWDRYRQEILDGQSWRCQACGGYGNEVHHKRPLAAGGAPWARSNLMVLCGSCHKRKHQKASPAIAGEAAWRDWLREMA